MSTITANYNTPVRGDYKVDSSKPMTDAETKAKVIDVQNENLQSLEKGLDQNSAGWGDKVKIKVPAEANGNPIFRPSTQDWENAAKTDSFATVEDTPSGLATRFYGIDLVDLGNSSDNLTSNKAFLQELQDALGKGITFPTTEAIPRSEVGNMDRALQAGQSANGEYVLNEIINIPNAGKILAEAYAVLGPAYNTELKTANDLREQMDSLKKKNDAITKFENTLDVNSAGNVDVKIDVPKTKYVYDKDGNKILDEKGDPKTQPVGNPLTNDDWMHATEFETVSGKAIDLAPKYIGVTYSTKGDHQGNLSNNTSRFANERTSVSSDMSKLTGQFDLHMGNAQTNLQNANKTIASINDMMMSISRAI